MLLHLRTMLPGVTLENGLLCTAILVCKHYALSTLASGVGLNIYTGVLIASHAVVFRGVVLPSLCGEEGNTTPLKTTAWEAISTPVEMFNPTPAPTP